MSYTINAQLDGDAPSLTLTDAATGEVRLQWRGDGDSARDWRSLFRRLVLLSCADRVRLIERARSARFGEECLECADCIDHRSGSLTDWIEFEQTGYPPSPRLTAASPPSPQTESASPP